MKRLQSIKNRRDLKDPATLAALKSDEPNFHAQFFNKNKSIERERLHRKETKQPTKSSPEKLEKQRARSQKVRDRKHILMGIIRARLDARKKAMEK